MKWGIGNRVRNGECLAGWQCTAGSSSTVLGDSTTAFGRMKSGPLEPMEKRVGYPPCNISSPSSEAAAPLSRTDSPSSFLV